MTLVVNDQSYIYIFLQTRSHLRPDSRDVKSSGANAALLPASAVGNDTHTQRQCGQTPRSIREETRRKYMSVTLTFALRFSKFEQKFGQVINRISGLHAAYLQHTFC
jgi:hypothetical protein